ncbi:zinc finger protein 862-like [Ptychodera flava]|uniref:zinc finger protein 862-like n=1 Tax=Ptychodera flava TaxID=63121 RepID=UPI003969C2C8
MRATAYVFKPLGPVSHPQKTDCFLQPSASGNSLFLGGDSQSLGVHTFASQAESSKNDMKAAVATAYERVEDAVVAQMRSVYYMAKENIANRKLHGLVELQILNGCEPLKKLKRSEDSGSRAMYTHHECVDNFQAAIESVIDDAIIGNIKTSPLKMYSLMIDESTDVSVTSTLMIYIRYVDSVGHIKSNFLSVEKLSGCDAESIYDAVVSTVNSKGLDLNNLVALATDGATVMTGTKSGVATRFKKSVNPFMLSNHCLAHRLALASGNAADSVKYLVKYQEIVNSIFKYFHFSPKNLRNLKSIQVVLEEESARTLKQAFHTRWLSFYRCVAALIACIDSLLTCFASQPNDIRATGFLKQIGSYKFLATTYFLKDALQILSKLCESLQKANLIYATVHRKLTAYIEALKGLKSGYGSAFSEFMTKVPNQNFSLMT